MSTEQAWQGPKRGALASVDATRRALLATMKKVSSTQVLVRSVGESRELSSMARAMLCRSEPLSIVMKLLTSP